MSTLSHIKTELAFALMHLPMRGQWRARFAKWGGTISRETLHRERSLL